MLLDSTFHGMYRDIRYAVNTSNRDYSELDKVIVDAFHKTQKPHEVSQKLWDELLETFRVGIEVGLCLNDNVHAVMHAVIMRVSRQMLDFQNKS